ncbi:MAG: hypothetical protein ACKOTF_10900, partial [Opitutaceae bacterium]
HRGAPTDAPHRPIPMTTLAAVPGAMAARRRAGFARSTIGRKIVMAVTGGILWFDNTFMGILTKLGSDIARTVHFYEAVLATLAIIVWHFYFVIFNPDVYPMNLAWLTGRLSEREMLEEHPLELPRWRPPEPPSPGTAGETGAPPDPGSPRLPPM